MSAVLCVDLGTTWGWALARRRRVVDWGEGNLPPASEPMGVRWLAWRAWLRAKLEEEDVRALIFEQPYGRWVNVFKIQFGMATILEAEAEERGLEYLSVRPQDIKSFATGRGNASKEDVADALLERHAEFGLTKPKYGIGQDVVDAIWMALYASERLMADGAEAG